VLGRGKQGDGGENHRSHRRWEEAEGFRRFADALSAATDLPDRKAESAVAACRYADQIDPTIKAKSARFRTCDYMEYEEWHGDLRGILGAPLASGSTSQSGANDAGRSRD